MFITPFTKGPETWKQYASWHFYVWNANCRVFTQREVPEIGFWGKSSIFTTPLQLSKAGSPTWCLQLETSLGTSYSRAEKPRLQAIKTQAVHSSICYPQSPDVNILLLCSSKEKRSQGYLSLVKTQKSREKFIHSPGSEIHSINPSSVSLPILK